MQQHHHDLVSYRYVDDIQPNEQRSPCKDCPHGLGWEVKAAFIATSIMIGVSFLLLLIAIKPVYAGNNLEKVREKLHTRRVFHVRQRRALWSIREYGSKFSG